jgi:hypothetical protein
VTLSEQAATLLENEQEKSELVASLLRLIEETNARLDKHGNLARLIVFNQAWSVETIWSPPR